MHTSASHELCFVLRQVLASTDEGRTAVLPTVPSILAVARAHDAEPAILAAALRCLRNVASTPATCDALLVVVTEVVAQLRVHPSNPEVVEAALGFLRSMAQAPQCAPALQPAVDEVRAWGCTSCAFMG